MQITKPEKEFVGVYRDPNMPNQRIPVHKVGDKYYGLLGLEADLSKMVKVEGPASEAN